MGVTRIRRAMNAGTRWAEAQLKAGIPITPDSAEKAAREKFSYAGLQHLFVISAFEVVLQAESKPQSQEAA